jgi:hypothetical protein
MRHIHWCVLVLVASSLTELGARAQFVGHANDAANIATMPTNIGEIRLPGDISANPVTRAIDADFYADADVDDWYLLNVVEDPSSTSCFPYGFARLFVTLQPATLPPTGASVSVKVFRDAAQMLAGSAGNDNANPFLFIADYGGWSCGSAGVAYVRVERSAGIATPLAYTLGLRLERYVNIHPQITAVSPTSGPVGTVVTISGKDLVPQIEFGGINASITNSSSTSIVTSVPPGAKTGPITVYSTPSQQVFTVMAPAAVGPSGPRAANPSVALAAVACCAVVPNPALVGRLGRLVVAFPAAAVPSGTPLAVVKDGHELQTGYGSQSWELLPGNYDLSVSGKVVRNVSVQSRSDTNVRVGVLRVAASSQTHWEVLDGGAAIANGYGAKLVGLPIGSYSLRISGQAESFTIRDGQITDF